MTNKQLFIRWLYSTLRGRVFSAIVLLMIAGIAALIVWLVKPKQEDPFGVWETMVVLRSQESGGSAEEDAKSSLKRGDVISVREPGHAWSETEYKSYLLVKIEGKRSEVDRLMEPLEKETGEKDEQGNKKKEIIRARKYAVDMNMIGYSGDQVINGQPLENNVHKIDIIKEK